jgi:predicted AlkP superfamily phosphohydrolase/phosphomutase
MEHAVYINLQGREPEGSVAQQEFDPLRQQIADALLAVSDSRSGRNQPVVQAAFLREELYQGPYVADAPDLLFSLAPGYEPTSELSPDGVWSDAAAEGAGIHQPSGILMMLGPGILPGARLPDCDMVDVLPTILYTLGLPVSTTLDGHIVKPAFDAVYLATHPPLYSDAPGPAQAEPTDPAAYSPEDAAQIEARLAALGYLG